MKHIIKITSIMLLISIFTISASASVVGSVIDEYKVDIAEGTEFTHRVLFSDQSGVGKQTENYIIYEPNGSVKPLITYGEYLYGASKTSDEISNLINQGKNPVAGTNADFFSLQTGVPMSNLIIDGEINTKDAREQYGIGFDDDGKAFISAFKIVSTMIKDDGTEVEIANINKYRQPYAIYLMTDKFAAQTQNTSIGVDVILSVVEGDMTVGGEMTAVVDSMTENEGSISIPEGKIVLTVDNGAPKDLYESLAQLKEGEKVTFKFDVIGDERWKDVKLGMGETGGYLIKDGEINSKFENGTAPRTAIGVTGQGKFVLYTIDGRQSGYSYGVKLETLARRMKELGCVDAINLDGGGSTTFAAALPGMSASIINRPSDRVERKVSTFFLFENLEKPTGIADKLYIYPRTSYLLSGASIKLDVKAVDKNYYPVNVTDNITYSAEKGTVSNDGVFTAKERGQIKVVAKSGNISGETYITCLETPTDIHAVSGGKTLSEIVIKRGEVIELDAKAFGGYNELVSSDELFKWEVVGDVGKVSDVGTFTASDNFDITGSVTITAGEKTVLVPVKIIRNGKEKEEDLRTNIEAEISNGKVSGETKSSYGKWAEKIEIFTDGVKIDAQTDDEKFSADIPEGTHKVTIYATSKEGYTEVKYIYLSELFENNNPFADTEENWAKDIISYMYNQKIISGESTDRGLLFRPQKQMTRAEFAVMCANYLKIDFDVYEDKIMPFADEDIIPTWAKKQLKALYYEGVFKGRADGEKAMADPNSTITRAEAATLISRLLPEGIKKAEITATDKTDIPTWAVDSMGKLVGIGAMNGYTDGKILPMGKLTKAEATKLFYSIK